MATETQIQFIENLLENTEMNIDEVREAFIREFGTDDEFDEILSIILD